MDIKKTNEILHRILEQTEHSIEYNNDKLDKAKAECIKDSNTKMWIEYNDVRLSRMNEEVDALRQAIRNTRRQQEFEDWKNKNF